MNQFDGFSSWSTVADHGGAPVGELSSGYCETTDYHLKSATFGS